MQIVRECDCKKLGCTCTCRARFVSYGAHALGEINELHIFVDSHSGMSGGDSLHPRPLGSALKGISAFFGRSGKTPRSPPDENAQSSASPAVVAVEETPVEHALVNMEAEEGTLLASESAGQTMVQLPLLVPPSSTEQELASSISKLQEALAVARELHEFTKDRNNVHAPIKKMSVSILSSLTCIERENSIRSRYLC